MYRKLFAIIMAAVILLALSAACFTVIADGEESEDDPLIAYSYVEKVLKPQLKEEIKAELLKELSSMLNDNSDKGASEGVSYTDGYAVSGTLLYLAEGSEIIIRAGDAIVITASDRDGFGLYDFSEDCERRSGDLIAKGHIYIAYKGAAIYIYGSDVFFTIRGSYEAR